MSQKLFRTSLLALGAAILLGLLASCSGAAADSLALTQYDSAARGYANGAWDPQGPTASTPDLEATLGAAQGRQVGRYTLIELDAAGQPVAPALSNLRAELADGAVSIYAKSPVVFSQFYLRYDPQTEHPQSMYSTRADGLSLVLRAGPGLLAGGVTGLRGQSFDNSIPIATLRFAPGVDTTTRSAMTVVDDLNSVVTDLAATVAEGDVTLNWLERATGDYNLDGIVAVQDLTPIGIYFQEDAVIENPDYAKIEVADGNLDTKISVQDLTPIGINFQKRIAGYNVYRTPLDNIDEEPLTSDTGRWTKIDNSEEPTGPSILRTPAVGQNTRLAYVFSDPALEAGPYAWYVTAVDLKLPPLDEGGPSNVAKTTVGPGDLPDATLTFEIQAPGSELANVNDEFYLAIKINNIEDLFSANVRFEYDNTLVEFIEAVPAYDANLNFLTPPLFLAVDDVTTTTAPYTQIGFNATQTQGTAVVDGTGNLGYFKFKCIGGGINPDCFKFPQGSTFIFLWGDQYGVSVADPTLGPAQNMNIAE